MLRDGASRALRPLYQLGYICDQPYFLIVVWTWRCSPTHLQCVILFTDFICFHLLLFTFNKHHVLSPYGHNSLSPFPFFFPQFSIERLRFVSTPLSFISISLTHSCT